MPDLKGDPYLVLNYNQDSGQSGDFQPDTIPDYRGMLTIVRYRDNTRPALEGDRVVAALRKNETDNDRWVTLLHGQGYQQLTGTMDIYTSTTLGILTEDINSSTTTIPLSTLDGLGVTLGGTGYADAIIQIDNELMRITAINASDGTVTVTRAWNDGFTGGAITAATSHTAGTLVYHFYGSVNIWTDSALSNNRILYIDGMIGMFAVDTRQVSLTGLEGVACIGDIVTLNGTTSVQIIGPTWFQDSVIFDPLATIALPAAATGVTPALNDNSLLIPTTAWVANQLSDSTPVMSSGTGFSGSSLRIARADHYHPSDTSRLALTGGTLTGALVLPASSSSLTPLRIPSGTNPTTGLVSGGIWNWSGQLRFYDGINTKSLAYLEGAGFTGDVSTTGSLTTDTLLQVNGNAFVTGAIQTSVPTSSQQSLILQSGSADPTSPTSGSLWNNAGTLKYRAGATTRTVALQGTNVSFGTVAAGNTNITGTLDVSSTSTLATTTATALSVDTGSGTRKVALVGSTDNATTITGTTTATQIHGTGSTYFAVNQNIRFSAYGTMSTTAGNSPNLTFTIRQGSSTVLGTVVVTTGAGMSASGNRWWFEADLAITSATTTTCMTACRYIADGNVSNNISGHRMQVDTSTTVTNVTTNANAFRIYAQWASTAGTCTVYGSSSVVIG